MDQISDVLTRGVENIISNKEDLEKLLRSGKKLNIYFGVDPTATHIHIGNAVGLRKLQTFVELGHNVTFLIGNFTALIGDNSDKESERPILTQEQIEENFRDYKKQAEKILDFSKIKIVHNGDWLQKLSFADIIKLCQNFSVGDFTSRELVRKRMDNGERVRLDEVIYPVMQGYDSYHLDTDIQIGGTDQTFNMQAGRTLQKNLRGKDSFIIANTFLEGTDGRKMSKSWGNAIWLDDSAEEMFGKVMSIKDDLIVRYFQLATNLPLDDIAQIESELALGKNPMVFKKTLAHQIVKELHGEEKAEEAQHQWQKRFQEKIIDESNADVQKVPSLGDKAIVSAEALVSTYGMVSIAESKRLLQNGAVTLSGMLLSRGDAIIINPGDILVIGKRIKPIKFV